MDHRLNGVYFVNLVNIKLFVKRRSGKVWFKYVIRFILYFFFAGHTYYIIHFKKSNVPRISIIHFNHNNPSRWCSAKCNIIHICSEFSYFMQFSEYSFRITRVRWMYNFWAKIKWLYSHSLLPKYLSENFIFTRDTRQRTNHDLRLPNYNWNY